MAADRDDQEWMDRPFEWAERVVYSGLALLLVAAAVALLVDAVRLFVGEIGDDVPHAVQELLDRLLLVFILIELLVAVRTTLAERRLVAEPFLLVGMIATIKELVVIGITAREAIGEGADEVDRSLKVIGMLTVVLLGLAVSGYLVRRKEREPDEVTAS